MADCLNRSTSAEEASIISNLSENSPPKKSQRSSENGINFGAAGEFDKEFDEDLSPKEIERFECTICFNWLNEPLLTDCGHKFCKSCLESWLKKNNAGCPSCNHDNPDVFPDNFTRREILSIRKSCKFRMQGCKIRLSPLELEKHMRECEFNRDHNRFMCHFSSIGCSFSTNADEALQEHLDQAQSQHLELLLVRFSKNQFENWEPQKTNGRSSTETELMQSMFERIVVLEQTNQALNIKLENLELQNARRKFSNGTLIWRIENFRKKVDSMASNLNLMYYSCEAFTNPEGYRFCARLNLSPKARDTLSLHIHLMKSENDYHLEWPFVGRIKISMIHPHDFKHSQIDTIMSKPEVQAFHRPQQDISNRGFGFMEYAFISDIFRRGFISDDDVLTFKIQMNIV